MFLDWVRHLRTSLVICSGSMSGPGLAAQLALTKRLSCLCPGVTHRSRGPPDKITTAAAVGQHLITTKCTTRKQPGTIRCMQTKLCREMAGAMRKSGRTRTGRSRRPSGPPGRRPGSPARWSSASKVGARCNEYLVVFKENLNLKSIRVSLPRLTSKPSMMKMKAPAIYCSPCQLT